MGFYYSMHSGNTSKESRQQASIKIDFTSKLMTVNSDIIDEIFAMIGKIQVKVQKGQFCGSLCILY